MKKIKICTTSKNVYEGFTLLNHSNIISINGDTMKKMTKLINNINRHDKIIDVNLKDGKVLIKKNRNVFFDVYK